jgi:hypothetical protein
MALPLKNLEDKKMAMNRVISRYLPEESHEKGVSGRLAE